MKKLILLLVLAFMMCGCMKQHVRNYGVVEKVELEETKFTDNGNITKYKVTLSDDFNGRWIAKVILYTNELYNLGDTLQIMKKN